MKLIFKVALLSFFIFTCHSTKCFNNKTPSPTSYCDDKGESLYGGDFDGNGAYDVLCHNSITGLIDVYLANRPAFSPDRAKGVSFCKDPKTTFVKVGDFNGDGRTDIFCMVRKTGFKQIMYANSDGGFTGIGWTGLSGWCTHQGAYVIVGDFNGDRRSDIMCFDLSGRMWVALAKTDQTKVFPVSDTYQIVNERCDGGRVLPGDFNGDGKTDLVCFSNADGRTRILISSPSNGKYPKYQYDNNSSKNKRWCYGGTSYITVADVNGDGRSDLICRMTTNGGKTFTLINTPPYGFDWGKTESDNFCINQSPGSFLAGDVNGDGKDDLICHGVNGQMQVSISSCT